MPKEHMDLATQCHSLAHHKPLICKLHIETSKEDIRTFQGAKDTHLDGFKDNSIHGQGLIWMSLNGAHA